MKGYLLFLITICGKIQLSQNDCEAGVVKTINSCQVYIKCYVYAAICWADTVSTRYRSMTFLGAWSYYVDVPYNPYKVIKNTFTKQLFSNALEKVEKYFIVFITTYY